MKNKYFKYWFLIIGIPLALIFVISPTEYGKLTNLLVSLAFSAPIALVFSMFHKWYREAKPKRYNQELNGRRVFTDKEIQRIGVLREILLWANIIWALWLPVIGIAHVILGITEGLTLGFIWEGAIIIFALASVGYFITIAIFYMLGRNYRFEIPFTGKLYKLRKLVGTAVMVFVVAVTILYLTSMAAIN